MSSVPRRPFSMGAGTFRVRESEKKKVFLVNPADLTH